MFLVWEPVILSDVAPPTSRALASISDPRVSQYWDHDRVLSQVLLDAARRPGSSHAAEADGVDVVWDFVALYPAGERWEEDLPDSVTYGYPIMSQVEDLRRSLAPEPRSEERRPTSPPGP